MIVVKLLQVLTLLAALAGTIGVLIINSRLDRLTEQIQTRQDLPLSERPSTTSETLRAGNGTAVIRRRGRSG